MDAEHQDISPLKIKAARSRFILIEQLSANELVTHIIWDDILPMETDDTFYLGLV
jgi:hypothetical protein